MKIFQIEIERKFECIDKKVGIMKIEDSLQEVKIMIFYLVAISNLEVFQNFRLKILLLHATLSSKSVHRQ